MADGINNSINSSISDYINTMSGDTDSVLRSIDLSLKAIVRSDGISISQSSLHDMATEIQNSPERDNPRFNNRRNTRQDSNEQRSNPYRRGEDRFDVNDLRRRGRISANTFFSELTDELESSFIEGLFGSRNPIRDALKGPLSQFADSLGVSVENLGQEVGRRLGQQVGNAFKRDPIGQQLTQEWQNIANMFTDMGSNLLNRASDFLNDPDSLSNMLNPEDRVSRSTSDLVDNSVNAVSDALEDMSGGVLDANNDISDLVNVTELAEGGLTEMAGEMGAGTDIMTSLMSATSSAAAVFPTFTVLLGAGVLALHLLESTIEEIAENFKNFDQDLGKVTSRIQSQYSKYAELSKQKIEADVKTLIETPFKILEQAANKVLDTWDTVLQTVAATQGYDKAGVQELWGSYVERLKEEGLDTVVSSADIMSNLENVLKSGLSGAAAEEFAYLATVLNNAVPTQDFFQYAETYASLAANAMKNSASEEEAIETANKALKDFASNIIYASREVAGGLTTSLSNASSLFESAAKIAVTSRGTGSVSEISAVLASVSAIVGSIAPDLASGVVDAVVNAAIGGNSDQITALRAMTSAGASNSAFLQALARDPQKLFSELFENLAELQNMSSSNFMEVAEGLSSVFGLSMDAFARVDFNYLAKAISEMNANSEALEDNMELLQSGQTTLTSEQLRMQQINKYMIDEGLAYVLDNEVAREVQRHMWEEQLAREIENSTYAVEVQGLLVDLVEGILNTVISILEKYGIATFTLESASFSLSALESAQLSSDLTKVLEAQKVGQGYESDRENLLSSGDYIHLIDKYPELIDLQASYSGTGGGVLKLLERLGFRTSTGGDSSDNRSSKGKYESKSTRGSKYYNWNVVSKSEDANVSGDWRTGSSYNTILDSVLGFLGELTSDTDKVQEFLDTIPQYTADMAATASSMGSSAKGISAAREEAENKYLTQAELEDLILNNKIEEEERSFDKWVENALDYGIYNLGQTLSDYGLTLEDVKAGFQQSQNIAEAKTERARQMHEVQFWENVEEYNNNYFPNHFENEFLRKDWMENWETTYLTPIRDDLHQLLTDWEDYYIHHTAYTDATANAFESAIELAGLEQDEMGDSVLALAQALTENSNWLQENQELLKDPVVHANVLLAQILTVTEAIMQQNNSTATTGAIPTTLLGLGTGGV